MFLFVGFKNVNQAQLINDVLYYPDSLDSQQWLVYFISRPLVGSLEPINFNHATVPILSGGAGNSLGQLANTTQSPSEASKSAGVAKKDVSSFNDLLNSFPMIARQMQTGLENIFKDFHKEMSDRTALTHQKSNTKHPRKASRSSSHSRENGSIHSRYLNGQLKSPSTATLNTDDEENNMRRALETAVTSAVDLFQSVDKQQLSFLGATTELTGPIVERLIEKYVTEQLHDTVLFPFLCNSRALDDLELDSNIHHMENIDLSQVGIAIEDGMEGKKHLTNRLTRGTEQFRKLGVAGSPQQMLDILLATQKAITANEPSTNSKEHCENQDDETISEKPKFMMTINADTLVSLLLVVVVRSQVRHLQARLTYIRNFIFIEDVESGEMGYALSTFEAVLSYLATDSGGLRKASRQNSRLWSAIKKGDLQEVQAILEQSEDLNEPSTLSNLNGQNEKYKDDQCFNVEASSASNGNEGYEEQATFANNVQSAFEAPNLAHVFPFQSRPSFYEIDSTPQKRKRVTMDMSSLPGFSEYSFNSRSASRTSTINSTTTGLEGDISIETLSQTQNFRGDSILMMAIESRQPAVLDYLLGLEHFFPIKTVLEDSNNEETTLLSAAIQFAHPELIDIILRRVSQIRDERVMIEYFSKIDNRGRTMAHYLFNAPYLISKLGSLLPWRQKDKNGQTPLLALCRSYDHPNYLDMVNDALRAATNSQIDNLPLHVHRHVDSKGNTLLHAVTEPQLALTLLRYCDSDPNAPNDKRFTPLMVASKYGRADMVRAFFSDSRVDLSAREYRGMTAVELAKDDDMRNRIDDMVLVSNIPAADGRVTAVVRSFFVEDCSIRLVIKSAIRNPNGTIGVTTCRRSLTDFENLARWLSVEHPASWIPSIFNFRSPFQIPSKPSRAVLQDIQVRLDGFLKVMLAHSTFATHELLWEFVLFPEIQPEMMAERSRKKAEIRGEKIKEDFKPVDDVREVENFVSHAREMIRGVNISMKSVTRRSISIRNIALGIFKTFKLQSSGANDTVDLTVAFDLCKHHVSMLGFLPAAHGAAFSRLAMALHLEESDPYKNFHQDLQVIMLTILAMLSALSRPHSLIASLQNIQKNIDRHMSSLRRSDRWPLGLLDDTRKGIHAEAQERVDKSKEELRGMSCELRYTQQTVAGELAGWQDLHAKLGRRAIKGLAERMVVREKCRLEGMKRAMRELQQD